MRNLSPPSVLVPNFPPPTLPGTSRPSIFDRLDERDRNLLVDYQTANIDSGEKVADPEKLPYGKYLLGMYLHKFSNKLKIVTIFGHEHSIFISKLIIRKFYIFTKNRNCLVHIY